MDTLKEYVAPQWASSLKNMLKFRVELVHGKTPIHTWSLPGMPKGFSLSIKRDDMTGSTLSGNKVRKLEFLLAEAIQRRCKHVITCGGIQSNHCRTVAMACRQLGMHPHLIVGKPYEIQNASEMSCDGNLLLDRMAGATIYLSFPGPSGVPQFSLRMEKLQQHIKSTTEEEAYVIPIGGSNLCGTFGYISAFEEMTEQGILDNYDDIVLAVGSGSTSTGLAIANYLTGSKLRVHGLIVVKRVTAKYVLSECGDTLKSIGIDADPSDILDVIEGYEGVDYGISTNEEIEFITQVCCSSGIVLDPTYTGKAAKGLVHELNNNPGRFKGSRILFIHTGGIFCLFDGKMGSVFKTEEVCTNRIVDWKTLDEIPVVHLSNS